jgi:hypothetical protein
MQFLAVVISLSTLANAQPAHARPIEVVVGESIAKVKLGMELRVVTKVVRDLKPEGVRRGLDRTGYKSGSLLVIFDEAARVISVSVDLPQSAGLRVGKQVIPAHADLDRIKQLLPNCDLSDGSGGRVLECTGKEGTMHFYDSFGNPKAVWAILP